MLNELFKSLLKSKTKTGMFDNFPKYSDREAWAYIDDRLKKHIILEAEELIGYRWPRFQATDYAEYYREGSRKKYDKVFKSVFDPVTKLAIAECIEGKGRFIDDLANGIFARCEDISWVHTGHLKQHGDEQIPKMAGKYLDLRCCSTGKQLAMVYYLLKDQLNEFSPYLVDRLEREIKVRILDRYLETEQWWTNLSDGHTVNNWNTHCNKCILVTAFIMEKDNERLHQIVEKACKSLDVFLSIYNDDGACNEGPGYWKGASLAYLDILILLSKVYKLNFDSIITDRIRNMGSYIHKVFIHNDYYLSYADGSGINYMYDIKLHNIGKYLKDNAMKQMAADNFRRHREEGQFYDYFIYILYDYIEYVQNYNELSEISKKPYAKEYYHKSTRLPDSHIFTARTAAGSEKGFFIGIKGGNNDESHNHNDLGTPYVYLDGHPVVIDPGAGAYTIKTFSPDRYDIWTMQSQWHSLPKINGKGQAAGKKYISECFNYTDEYNIAWASMELSNAYEEKEAPEYFLRKIELNRGNNEVVISDEIRLRQSGDEVEFYLTIINKPVLIKPGYLVVQTQGDPVRISYNPKILKCEIEEKNIYDDKKLSVSWGSSIGRVCFRPVKPEKQYSIKLKFERSQDDE